MRPERVAGVVLRWARLYTRGLSPEAAERRVAEIEADLHDHMAHARDTGASERRSSCEIALRMVRGFRADLAWRRQQAATAALQQRRRSVARIGIAVGIVLSLPLLAMQFTESVVWSLSDFVVAGALLVTVAATVESAWRRAGNVPLAAAVGVLGVAAAVTGEGDDAPGLVLLGVLLAASACAVGLRSRQRSRKRL